MGKIIKNGIEYGGGTAVVPIASASTLGGIKVGRGLSIDPVTGVLNRDDTPITYTALDDVVDPTFTLTEDNKCIITWTDPDDIPGSGGGYLAQWAYTMLVRKYDGIPQSPTDGTVICTSRLRDEFSVNGFKDVNLDMTQGVLVFYRFFTVTTDDFHTYGEPHMFINGSFGTISDENLAKLLQRHYNGELDVSQIFKIGDRREFTVSSMPATYVSESHAQQTIRMKIIDFDHDDLSTPINGKTKAAITLLMDYSLDEKGGYDSTGNRIWETSARRSWCNEIFRESLPSIFKSCVKQVSKVNYGRSSTDDYCWYPSGTEVGVSMYVPGDEGTKYSSFSNNASRKKTDRAGTGVAWLCRTYATNGSYVLLVQTDGSSAGGSPTSATRGIIVGLCL